MNLRVTGNEKYMKSVFNELKNEPIVTDSYLGNSVISLYVKGAGLAYTPGTHLVSTILGKKSKLIKKFNELTKEKKITLEEIN